MSQTTTKTPAPPLYLTLTMVFRDDGSAWVPVDAVAGQLGGLTEYALNRAKAHKVPFGCGPVGEDGGFGFELADAVRLIRKVRAEQEDHDSRWRRYVAHREEVKRATAEKRAAEMAAAREAERKRQEKMAKRMEEEAARRAEQAAIEAAARRAEREGHVVEFERWAG